jgi:carboxyl-terminal processing protease
MKEGKPVQPDSANQTAARSSVSRKVFKRVGMGIVICAVFLAGIGIGNGAIHFAYRPNSNNKSLPRDLDYSSVEQLYDLLKSRYDGKLNTQALLDGLKSGLVKAAGDPYTQYFNPDEAKKFNAELSGSFTGIGAVLGQDVDGNLIVVAPIEGFPASKAGLRSQDIIVSINGEPTNGQTVDEAVNRIRGPKDTKVTLRVLRNKSQDLSFTITRADIKVPSVKWEVLDNKVGYIKINQFSDDTAMLSKRAAQEFTAAGVKSVILDMRDNPGGLLDAAVEVSGLWLPAGKTVLQEKQGGVVTNTYTAAGDAVLQDLPTVVLVNKGSASASEIVAGALRDNNIATLYGEKTYGKGSVQKIDPLPNGGEIKITVARWYRPNGQNIDKKGIGPDKAIPMSDDDTKQQRDPQKDAALQYLQSRQ